MYSYISTNYWPLAKAYYEIDTRTRSKSVDRLQSAFTEAKEESRPARASSAERAVSRGYTPSTRSSPTLVSSYELPRSYYPKNYSYKTAKDSFYYSPTTYSKEAGSNYSYYRNARYPSMYDYYNPYQSPYYSRYYSPYSDIYYCRSPYLSAYNPYYTYVPMSARSRIYA